MKNLLCIAPLPLYQSNHFGIYETFSEHRLSRLKQQFHYHQIHHITPIITDFLHNILLISTVRNYKLLSQQVAKLFVSTGQQVSLTAVSAVLIKSNSLGHLDLRKLEISLQRLHDCTSYFSHLTEHYTFKRLVKLSLITPRSYLQLWNGRGWFQAFWSPGDMPHRHPVSFNSINQVLNVEIHHGFLHNRVHTYFPSSWFVFRVLWSNWSVTGEQAAAFWGASSFTEAYNMDVCVKRACHVTFQKHVSRFFK